MLTEKNALQYKSQTFSISETKILAKQGKLGTKGFRVIRGAAKICKSTTCNPNSTCSFIKHANV
jgi:hypothetical protein